MSDGIPRVGTTHLAVFIGPDMIRHGDHQFKRVNGQWHLNVGLGNWVKTSEPVVGEKVGSIFDGRRKGTVVYYGDPNIYRLTWTEYEEVGALDDTFFVVFQRRDKVEWFEMPNALRGEYDAAPSKWSFIHTLQPNRLAAYISAGSTFDGKWDRSRDNPACVIYVT